MFTRIKLLMTRIVRRIIGKEDSFEEKLKKANESYEKAMDLNEEEYHRIRRSIIEKHNDALTNLGFTFNLRCSECNLELESNQGFLKSIRTSSGYSIDIYVCPICGKVEYIDPKYRPALAIRYKVKAEDFMNEREILEKNYSPQDVLEQKEVEFRYEAMKRRYFKRHPEEWDDFINTETHAQFYKENDNVVDDFKSENKIDLNNNENANQELRLAK